MSGRFSILEVVGENAVLRENLRQDVAPEVVAGARVFRVRNQDGNQQLRVKNVNAHGDVGLVGMQAGGLRFGGFLLETQDAPVGVGLDDAEPLGGLGGVHLDGGDGHVGVGVNVLLQHFPVVHFVDVVAGKDEGKVGALAADGVNVLVDGVGSSQVPAGGDAHLRGQDFDEVAQAHQGGPAFADVAIEAQRFVLREDEDAAEVAIDAVRKREVDDSIDAPEWHSGFRAVTRQGPKPLALSACQENANGVAHQRGAGQNLAPDAPAKALFLPANRHSSSIGPKSASASARVQRVKGCRTRMLAPRKDFLT